VRFALRDEWVESIALNWELEADYFFGEGEIPGGAEIEIVFGKPDQTSANVVVEGELGDRRDPTHLGFDVQRIQIHALAALPPESKLSFEPSSAAEGVLLHTNGETHQVVPQVAIPIDPPESCLTGSCDWSLLLTGTGANWQLTSPPNVTVTGGVAEVRPVELQSPVLAGRLDLEAGEPAALSFVIEIDERLYYTPDFDEYGPLASIEVALSWDDENLDLRVQDFIRLDDDSTTRLVYQALELTCDGSICRAMATTPVSFFPEDGSGKISFEATVFVPYLITGKVPDVGEIRIEAQP
jgi:hypothetical protein